MLPEHVVDKLKYFNSSKYIVENGKVELKEKKKEGKVHLICKLKNCTLIFNDPEKNTLPYLDENIKYAKSCPDKFLFELDLDDKWILHVMEFKKTINTSTIAKSKRQFVMGIYNARALAAFLNIEIKEVRIYSAYSPISSLLLLHILRRFWVRWMILSIYCICIMKIMRFYLRPMNPLWDGMQMLF